MDPNSKVNFSFALEMFGKGDTPGPIPPSSRQMAEAKKVLEMFGKVIPPGPVPPSNRQIAEAKKPVPEYHLKQFNYDKPIDWSKIVLPPKPPMMPRIINILRKYALPNLTVKIGDRGYNCHCLLLQCFSKFFERIDPLETNMVELSEEIISQRGFSVTYQWMMAENEEDAISLFKHENILDVLEAAKYLEIHELEETCWFFINGDYVYIEDRAFALYKAAKHGREVVREIMEIMYLKIQKFFLTLVATKDYLDLEITDIKTILSSNCIVVWSELEVFMSGVRWLIYDWEEREKYVLEVMSCVRFGLIPAPELLSITLQPEYTCIIKRPEINEMIRAGIHYSFLKARNCSALVVHGQINPPSEAEDKELMKFGLKEPMCRNWGGPHRTYHSYSEFLEMLDRCRTHYMWLCEHYGQAFELGCPIDEFDKCKLYRTPLPAIMDTSDTVSITTMSDIESTITSPEKHYKVDLYSTDSETSFRRPPNGVQQTRINKKDCGLNVSKSSLAMSGMRSPVTKPQNPFMSGTKEQKQNVNQPSNGSENQGKHLNKNSTGCKEQLSLIDLLSLEDTNIDKAPVLKPSKVSISVPPKMETVPQTQKNTATPIVMTIEELIKRCGFHPVQTGMMTKDSPPTQANTGQNTVQSKAVPQTQTTTANPIVMTIEELIKLQSKAVPQAQSTTATPLVMTMEELIKRCGFHPVQTGVMTKDSPPIQANTVQNTVQSKAVPQTQTTTATSPVMTIGDLSRRDGIHPEQTGVMTIDSPPTQANTGQNTVQSKAVPQTQTTTAKPIVMTIEELIKLQSKAVPQAQTTTATPLVMTMEELIKRCGFHPVQTGVKTKDSPPTQANTEQKTIQSNVVPQTQTTTDTPPVMTIGDLSKWDGIHPEQTGIMTKDSPPTQANTGQKTVQSNVVPQTQTTTAKPIVMTIEEVIKLQSKAVPQTQNTTATPPVMTKEELFKRFGFHPEQTGMMTKDSPPTQANTGQNTVQSKAVPQTQTTTDKPMVMTIEELIKLQSKAVPQTQTTATPPVMTIGDLSKRDGIHPEQTGMMTKDSPPAQAKTGQNTVQSKAVPQTQTTTANPIVMPIEDLIKLQSKAVPQTQNTTATPPVMTKEELFKRFGFHPEQTGMMTKDSPPTQANTGQNTVQSKAVPQTQTTTDKPMVMTIEELIKLQSKAVPQTQTTTATPPVMTIGDLSKRDGIHPEQTGMMTKDSPPAQAKTGQNTVQSKAVPQRQTTTANPIVMPIEDLIKLQSKAVPQTQMTTITPPVMTIGDLSKREGIHPEQTGMMKKDSPPTQANTGQNTVQSKAVPQTQTTTAKPIVMTIEELIKLQSKAVPQTQNTTATPPVMTIGDLSKRDGIHPEKTGVMTKDSPPTQAKTGQNTVQSKAVPQTQRKTPTVTTMGEFMKRAGATNNPENTPKIPIPTVRDVRQQDQASQKQNAAPLPMQQPARDVHQQDKASQKQNAAPLPMQPTRDVHQQDKASQKQNAAPLPIQQPTSREVGPGRGDPMIELLQFLSNGKEKVTTDVKPESVQQTSSRLQSLPLLNEVPKKSPPTDAKTISKEEESAQNRGMIHFQDTSVTESDINNYIKSLSSDGSTVVCPFKLADIFKVQKKSSS